VKTTVEKLSPTRVKLSISVTPEDLKPSIEHAYKHIGEQVNIPGFRKGKIPPQLIDQRVGRGEVLNHAVSDGLDKFYRQAVSDEKVRVLGRPEADVVEWPEIKDFSGDLLIAVEVDVRPEFDLPDYEGLQLEVSPATVAAEDVDAELEKLRTRFGTLVTVDRPAAKGDFVQLDLVASIDENEVDSAQGISYEVGSGELIEGIDEAVDGLSADEITTFESVLLGGEHAGSTALVTVTLSAVKERELPDVDDDFAQMASQFDTVDELKADLEKQLGSGKSFEQGAEARDQIVDKLLEGLDIPVPAKLVEDEVHRHLEGEGRLEDEEHRTEVTEASEKTFRSQILLDSVVEKEEVKVSQNELTSYLVQGAQQYGMEPGEFIQALDQNGQIPSMIAEVARVKALAAVLAKATVKDTNGADVDISEFTQAILGDENDDSPVVVDASDEDDEHAGHSH